jgi:ferredoxin
MPIVIDEEGCIACESCVEVCDSVFSMDDPSGKAIVTDPDSEAECVEEAIDMCPTDAIFKE